MLSIHLYLPNLMNFFDIKENNFYDILYVDMTIFLCFLIPAYIEFGCKVFPKELKPTIFYVTAEEVIRGVWEAILEKYLEKIYNEMYDNLRRMGYSDLMALEIIYRRAKMFASIEFFIYSVAIAIAAAALGYIYVQIMKAYDNFVAKVIDKIIDWWKGTPKNPNPEKENQGQEDKNLEQKGKNSSPEKENSSQKSKKMPA